MTDQCERCGRFVGNYPVNFHCDTHCKDCTCHRCRPGDYAAPRPSWVDVGSIEWVEPRRTEPSTYEPMDPYEVVEG